MRILNYRILDNGKIPEAMKQDLAGIFPTLAGKQVRLTIETIEEIKPNNMLYVMRT